MAGKSVATHQAFLDGLRKSHRAVWFVARILWTCDQLYVKFHPHSEAARWEDAAQHSDDGDLYYSRDGITWTRLEVKRLGENNKACNFTSAQDWPFKPHFIVDSQPKFDKKDPVPDLYLVLNQPMTHYGKIVVPRSREAWYVQPRLDPLTKQEENFYLCNLQHVTFGSVEDIANGKT